jgi:hypothetical protein
MDHDDPKARDSEPILVTIRPGLHITPTCFRVGGRHFQLASLRELETRQSAHDPLTRQAAVLAGGGLLMLALLARYMHPAGIAATAAVLSGLVVVALVSAQRRPRRQELWAVYKGHSVQLFGTDDLWLFGAVERQLRRSMTETRLGHTTVPHPARPRPSVPHPSMVHPSKMYPVL